MALNYKTTLKYLRPNLQGEEGGSMAWVVFMPLWWDIRGQLLLGPLGLLSNRHMKCSHSAIRRISKLAKNYILLRLSFLSKSYFLEHLRRSQTFRVYVG
jgi:hypothetical protein